MGRDLPAGPRPLLLHLLAGPPDHVAPMDGVPHAIAELAAMLPDGPAARSLRALDGAIGAAVAGFPDRATVAAALRRASGIIEKTVLPAGADDIAHRLARKRRQLDHAIAVATGTAEPPPPSPPVAPGRRRPGHALASGSPGPTA